LSVQDGDYRREFLSSRDFEIKASESFKNRTLSVRKRETHFWTPVNPASKLDDLWKSLSCFLEKRFGIIGHKPSCL
jgi:hypothetical protein